MSISILPDERSTRGKKQQVEAMFDGIAHRYDFLNRVLSLRVDVLWRKKVIRLLKPLKPQYILDVATGTGDLAIALKTLNPVSIHGLDLSEQMLKQAKVKKGGEGIHWLKGDSEHLPFETGKFDAVTVAFGVRNFENLEEGLKEMYRVLKPGGELVILEFSKVKMAPFKQLFSLYFRYITPFIGRIFSKSQTAYTYLYNSVRVFPEGEEMNVILQEQGFKTTKCHRLSLGIASIYHCQK